MPASVSSLDVSVQAQVVDLLEDLQQELRVTLVFIAPDLSVIRHVADRLRVVSLVKIIEIADRDMLDAEPLHPCAHLQRSEVPVSDPRKELRSE